MKNRSHRYSSPTALKSCDLVCLPLSQKSSFPCSGEKSLLFQLTLRGSPVLWGIRCPLLFTDTISTLVWTIDSSVLSQASRVMHEHTSPCSRLGVHPPELAIMPNVPPSSPDELFAAVQITRLSWLQTFISVFVSPWKIQIFILLTLSLCILIAFSR